MIKLALLVYVIFVLAFGTVIASTVTSITGIPVWVTAPVMFLVVLPMMLVMALGRLFGRLPCFQTTVGFT